VKVLQQKEFWFGAVAAFLVIKFGDRLPVVGPAVAKLKL
jgi:hypothetical protein